MVRGPTLAFLVMVLVLLSIGNTSGLRIIYHGQKYRGARPHSGPLTHGLGITRHWKYSCFTNYGTRAVNRQPGFRAGTRRVLVVYSSLSLSLSLSL